MLFQLPLITGILDRRILLNYSIDPDYLKNFLPQPFRPRLYNGVGVGGICMIRFSGLRPQFVPSFMGIDSENAAHRIAVEWEVKGKKFEGVFIPKRNTASRFNYFTGGRIFPGIFQMSQFLVNEHGDQYQLKIIPQGQTEPMVEFDGEVSDQLSEKSIFPNLDLASDFFAKGSIGYSLSADQSHFQGMELRMLEWDIKPMRIKEAAVHLFENSASFPRGTAKLDSAMIMRTLRHEWHRIPEIRASV
jgi:hypothetical protein